MLNWDELLTTDDRLRTDGGIYPLSRRFSRKELVSEIANNANTAKPRITTITTVALPNTELTCNGRSNFLAYYFQQLTSITN